MMDSAEVTKTDVEKKVEKILKLIKRRNRAKKEPELVVLVEEFYKQYQSLYAQYDHLKRESGNKGLEGKGNESCSYHASGSDSEYYSSDDIEISTAFNNNRSSHRRIAGNMDEELKRAFVEVADLKRQLASMTEEKEALPSDHLAALSKIQEIETINRDVRKELDEKEKRLSALAEVHKEKGDEVTKLMKQIKDNENSLTSKIEGSMALVSKLKKEVDYLRAQKCEAEGNMACKTDESFDQAIIMKQELDSLCSQKMESEIELGRKSKEISQCLIKVKTLEEELARKSAVEETMAEEIKCLQVQVMDLESEVDTLHKQTNRSEDEERSNIHEIDRLREEKCHLNSRVVELEALFRESGLELSALHGDGKSERIEETAQIMNLNAEVELLQQKLDSMKIEKGKLELQIADQQRITKEREESTNKSMDSNYKLGRRLSSGSTLNYHALERKMEDLAQEFRQKAEDSIRILYQRITVAEKIHYENKEIYKTIKEKLEEENGALKQKLATCEAEFKKLSDTMEPGKNALTGLNDGNSLTCISEVAAELVPTNECNTVEENGIKLMKNNVDLVVAEVNKENEELLREKVSNLEAKLSEEGEEKSELLKAVSELEERVGELEKMKKEKDEILLGREEEKREAIRQLCLLIDYHRSRCDYLKELISKLNVRSKKKT